MFKYYLEFKNRFLLIFFCWFFTLIICYFYKEVLLFILINFVSYGTFIKPYFIFTNVTEVFSVYLKIIFFVSNQIIFINFCYHTLLFFLTGFYEFECKYMKFLFKVLLVSWCVSIFFLNTFFVDYSWKFFLSYNNQQIGLPKVLLFFESKLDEYCSFYINSYYLCIISFQFFIFLVLIINNVNKDLAKIKTFRKSFYFLFLVFSTFVTPPDVFSQLLISFLLFFIYEFLIFIKIYNEI